MLVPLGVGGQPALAPALKITDTHTHKHMYAGMMHAGLWTKGGGRREEAIAIGNGHDTR